jgi:putative ABC transport system permease protein
MSSFVWVMNKSVEMQYGGYDLDVLINTDGDLDRLAGMQRILASIPDSDVQMIRRTCFETMVPEGFFTEKALNTLTDENKYGILIFSLPDAEFSKIVHKSQGEADGILINTTGSFASDSKIREYTPYNCQIGTQLPLSGRSREGEPLYFGTIAVAAIIDKIPANIIAPLFEGYHINILVSETVYRDLYQADRSFAYFSILAADPDAFTETAIALLQPYSEYYSIVNVSQMTRLNRNITLIIMLFGYGFIAMLSLIAVTSVIATISTGMSLRRQEFAMLYSAGMTPEGMNKMLNLESLLYGMKSLLIGIPVGLALSYLIYLAMGATAEFAFKLPWSVIVISGTAVMLLTFGTMHYGKRKLRKINIVEAIRNEAV